MASTFTTLGIEKMATGENAGTWGDKTNTNLDIVNTAVSGYVEQAVTNGGTLALSITDGASTATAQNAVIKLTGTITGNSIVTVPDSVEKVYIVTNGTSGAYTVQFKTASGTGVTFGVSEKTTKLLYSDGTNIVDAGFSGSLDLEGRELILDADGDTSLTADTDDQIDIKIGGTDQIKLVDGAIVPVTDNDIDLGTASLEFKDAFFDGTVTADAFAGPLTGNVTGNVSGTAATVTTAAQSNITSLGTLTTLTVDDITINGSTISDSGDFTVDGGADIILDADGGDIFFKDGGTTFGSATNTSGNLIIKSGTTTALTFSGANVTVAGDLTVSGDDITMGTNTAGHLLIADGTNFNSIAATSLSEISTIANDDVFLAVDTSGGGLKKVARSTVVSGLATSAAISNVSEDTSPQLGGNLDMNGADIVTTSNADLELAPNGTGHVTIRGNTNPGTIQFNCESNSHGQQLKAQPHSVGSSAVHTLPNVTGELVPGKIEEYGSNFTGSLLVGHSTHGTLDAASNNTGVGIQALDALTTADNSTAVGYQSGTAVTTSPGNTLFGTYAGREYATGTGYNTNIGYASAYYNATGNYNTAVGALALYGTSGQVGNKNVAIGRNALQTTYGDLNIAIGYHSGNNITTGDGNVVIGQTDVASATGDNQLSISSGQSGGAVWITGDSSGNLTFAADVTLGDDLHLDSDAAVLKFGDDGEITLTHDADVGLKLKHTATADDKPIVLTLQTGETDMAANDVMGAIRFQAPDEGTGTDAILVAAAIQAVSEGDFSSSSNATKLEFHTGASEAASSKMTLSSAGLLTIADDLMIKDGGTIGVASTNDALTISSAGIVTFKDDILIKDAGTIGSASDTDAIAIGADGDVTLTQDLELQHDGAILSFGANDEVTLTHVHNDGLLLNTDMQLQFRDSAINIRSDADGDLDINADDEVEINSTLIDINGNVEMSGTLAQTGVATFAVAANVAQVALSSSSNAVAWDASAAANAFHVTTENTTFSAPSNAVEGAFICLEINYNGSHTIAFNTVFEFAASTAPTTTDTDGKTDILVFRYNGAVWQEVGRTLNLAES